MYDEPGDEPYMPSTQSDVDKLQEGAHLIVDGMAGLADSSIEHVQVLLNKLIDSMQELIVDGMANLVIEGIDAFFEVLRAFQRAWEEFCDFLEGIEETIKEILIETAATVKSAYLAVKAEVEAILETVEVFFQNVADFIAMELIPFIQGKILNVIGAAADVIGAAADVIRKLETVIKKHKEFLVGFAKCVHQCGDPYKELVSHVLAEVASKFAVWHTQFMQDVGQLFTGVVVKPVEAVVGAVGSAVDDVGEAVGSAVNNVLSPRRRGKIFHFLR